MATNAELAEQGQKVGNPDELSILDMLGGAAENINQGITMGLSDEIIAGAKSIFSDKGFDELRQETTNVQKNFNEKNPTTGAALLGASAAVPAFFTGNAAANAQVGQGVLKQILGQGALGGIEGGVTSAATADGPAQERAAGARDSTLIGFVAGGAGPAAGQTFSKLANSLKSTRLSRLLNGTLEAEGITQGAARDLRRKLGPQSTLADMSTGVRAAAKGIVDQSPRTRALAQNTLEGRSEGTRDRILNSINEIIGERQGKNAAIGDLADFRSTQAKPLYDELEKVVPKMTPAMKKMVGDTDVVKDAYKAAQRIYNTETGNRLPELFDEAGNVSEAITMREWASIDQGISSLMDNRKYFNPTTERLTKEGRALSILRKRLVGELDGVSDLYRDARMAWGGETLKIDAIEEGSKALRGKVDDVVTSTSMMGEEERDAFLTGMANDIRERLSRAPTGQLGALRSIRQAGFGDKMKFILDKEQQEEMLQAISREVEFSQTSGELVGGSQTASRNQARDNANKVVNTAKDLAQGNFTGAVSNAFKSASKLSDNQAVELTEMLVTPGGFEKAMKELERSNVSEELLNAAKVLFGSAGQGGASAQARE